MSFTFADPRQLWLEISTTTQTSARQASQHLAAPGGRWQAYLNQLCLRTCLPWIRSEISAIAAPFPALTAAPTSWEMITGSSITVGDRKLAFIPSDAIGKDELQVPQEWVDIPTWAADYYLAVKVNPAENWLEIWGYLTHQQLKTNGAYDPWERAYSIETVEPDIPALWAILEHCPTADVRAERVSNSVVLPVLSPLQAESLIARLASPEVAFPRLSVPFAQWGALLANETWRHPLDAERLARLQPDLAIATGQPGERSPSLRRLQAVMTAGWQSIEAVFSTEAQQLAFGFRQNDFAPGTPAGKQAKVLGFGHQSVRLVLLWQQDSDERLTIRVQLYPADGELHLPRDLTITLISAQDEVLQSIQSGAENNYIQLQRFKCPADYAFRLEIQLGEQTMTEHLVT